MKFELDDSLRLFGHHCRNMVSNEYYSTYVEPVSDRHTMDLLRPWYNAKSEYLFRLLGDNYILTRNVEIELDENALRREMTQYLDEHQYFIDDVIYTVRSASDYWNLSYEEQLAVDKLSSALRDSFDYHNMIDGTFPATVEVYLYHKRVALQAGQKIMRAWKAITDAVDMSDQFESFRIGHSQILNTRKIKGELCLSVHPMDYATASDNANGWSSCMSWAENGCYRAGTLEMLTSPMVLCAYLKSHKNEWVFENVRWNSKRWRAWALVDERFILCNRNYPYNSDVLADTVINWIKELAQTNLGWKYNNTISAIYDDRRFWFRTNLMYNDIGEDERICYGVNVPHEKPSMSISFSGQAHCINCGSELEDGEADTLLCADCRGIEHCCECGCAVDEDSMWRDEAGNVFCYDCYHDYYGHCDCCDQDYPQGDLYTVGFAINDTQPILRHIEEKWDHESPEYKAVTSLRLWTNDTYIHLPSSYNFYTFCKECLDEVDIDVLDDCVFESGEYYIDPRKVTFEQVNKLMNFFSPAYRSSSEATYRLMWEYYTKEFIADHP